ncbi:MAG TPA: hypothetical protein VGA50_04730 [Kiloniellales bacterium]
MKAATAAAYLDEGLNTFLRRVAAGLYPPGLALGGNRYWFREDLDAALDRLKQAGAGWAPGNGQRESAADPARYWQALEKRARTRDGGPEGEARQ